MSKSKKSSKWLGVAIVFSIFLGWQYVKYHYTGVIAFSRGGIAMGIVGASMGLYQWRKERERKRKEFERQNQNNAPENHNP